MHGLRSCVSLGLCDALPDVVNLSVATKFPPAPVRDAIDTTYELNQFAELLASFPASTLIVAAAGNRNGVATPLISLHNYLADLVDEHAPTALVVAGSAPGGATSTNDEEKLNTLDGPEVDLAAPARVWVVDDDNSGSSSYGSHAGTSFAAPLVSSAAALVYAIGSSPSGSADAITMADAASVVTANTVNISSIFGSPAVRLDLFGAVLDTLEWAEALDTEMRVYAVDNTAATLYSQVVDPSDGTFDASSAESHSVSSDGCSSPGAVEVDPRGDLVYVLCTGSPGAVYVYNAQSLDFIDSESVSGDIDLTTEMVVTMDGVIVVPSATSGSTASVALWDSLDGASLGEVEVVSSDVNAVQGAAALTYGTTVAVATYDGSQSDGDGEQVAIIEVDAFDRDPADAVSSTVQDHSSVSVGYIGDVDWYVGDDTLNAVFYTNTSGWEELSEIEADATLSDYGEITHASGTFDVNNHYTIATNPSGEDAYAYIGEQDSQTFVMTDVTQVGDHYPDAYYEYAPGGSTTWYPRNAAFSQNGRFVALGFTHTSTSAQIAVWTVPHDASATGLADVSTVGDAMSQTFRKMRGLAISPAMSLLSPRPGKELSGKHRVHVLLRDPDVVTVSYELDGAAISGCPDDSLLDDGISDACVLDTTGWSDADDHVLEVRAEYSDGTGFSIWARY